MYWHIFPTYGEAKDAVWREPTMLFNLIPRGLIERVNESELIVYFKNGSIYQLKGADNPDALRGAAPVGLILDEFAKMKYETWEVLEPILRQNGGWCWFISTPNGKNHLYNLYQRGREEDDEWKSWLLKASSSGIISADQLERSRKTVSQAKFNQEWECEFLEGEGQVFRNVREACTAEPKKPIDGHYYVMGVDLAKVQDYTVITVYDRSTNEQVFQDRFQTLEWPFQKKRIQTIAFHYNKALVVLDATGIGDPIADDLLRAGVAVDPVKITEQSKKEMIEKLSVYIEQKTIKMLPLEETLHEFDNFAFEVGPTGRIRYGAPEGLHDDIVISHALAVHQLNPIIVAKPYRDPTPMQMAYNRAKYEYQNNDRWGGWE